jgi:hypothetical protein
MKRFLLIGLIGCYLPVGTAMALPNGKAVGAVAGAAAGLIIANNVHGVNPWVAAPVGALLGGYLGSRYEDYRRYQGERDDGRYDRRYDDRYDRTRHGDYYRPGYRRGYGYDRYPETRTEVICVEKREKKATPAPVTPGDPHPGVDLIKVSILNSNGIRTDIPILRVKGKFVGPQGEPYETLPTAEQLAKRYGM